MKRKNKFAICKCCNKEKHSTEITQCMKLFTKIEKEEFGKRYNELKLEQYSYPSFVNSNFEWACDECIENKKAIISNPKLQETPFSPHLSYSDEIIRCQSCNEYFTFRKEEKKAWYESYKLPILNKPNACLPCRRAKRKKNEENKILSESLQKEENILTKDELNIIIDIYTEWNKPEKVKYYQSLLNKK